MNRRNMRQSRKYIQGFTIIELLIVFALMAIIAAIAIPTYQNYTLSTYRKAAIADILSIQQDLEQQYTLNNGAYRAVSAPASGNPARYNMAVTLADNNQTYTITATATAIQAGEECGNLRVNSDDVRMVNTGGGWAVDTSCF